MSSSDQQQNLKKSRGKSPLRNKNNLNNSFNQNPSNIFKDAPNIKLVSESYQQNSSIIQDSSSLSDQNKKLRRKLKQLSLRLDEQLQRAAQNKLKMQNLAKMNHPMKPQSQNIQLQNAYKMIQRLQKTVKDFQNKQSYQVTVKRILDLQSIIKKKQNQIQELKQQVKTNKKIIRQKQKHIAQLLENAKKEKNVTEDKQFIQKLKKKLKKTLEENDQLRKKQLTKHEQLVKAERKLIQIEQNQEIPIGRQQSLLNQLQQMKKKYREAMSRVQKQNIYITKLNQKLSRGQTNNSKNKGRQSEGQISRRQVSKSLQELPSLKKANKINLMNELLQHLPSPKAPVKLKRYT